MTRIVGCVAAGVLLSVVIIGGTFLALTEFIDAGKDFRK